MKDIIIKQAKLLGFDDCKVTAASPPETGRNFERWLAGNRHGQMEYLQRNAHKRLDPQNVLPGAKSILTLAVSYATAADVKGPNVPGQSCEQRPEVFGGKIGCVARYARYSDYHKVIGVKLRALAEFIDSIGKTSTRSLWYVDTGPLLERDLAQRAGLGFIGKHTNLISRKMGNWIFLAEILTTLELEPDKPEINACGSCTRCLSACPTGAITAPFQLDSRRCISYLTIELKGSIPVELRPAIGNRVYGCDDCLAVCPWNRFAQEGRMMKEHIRPEVSSADLLQWITLDAEAFRKRFEGTPMMRAKRTGLVRNCCVVLGNVGDSSVLPALERISSDADAIIAEHAVWAIKQIESRCLGKPDQLS